MTDYDRGFEDGAEAIQRQLEDELARLREENKQLLQDLRVMTDARDMWRRSAEEAQRKAVRAGTQRDTLLAALRAAEKELASGDPASALRRMQRAIAEVEGEK